MDRHRDRGGKETDGAPKAAVRAGGGRSLTATQASRSLLRGAIDYAGLFPPASLGMNDAVAEYARHREAPDEWALGRFVVPLSRWSELSKAVAELAPGDVPWPVSLLASPSDSGIVRNWEPEASQLVVKSVECKVESVDDVLAWSGLMQRGLEVYLEASRLSDFGTLVPAVANVGAAGKIRTGGVTAEAFPSARDVLAFLRACRSAGIRFKATAGLHHAIRGEYRLTYEPTPPTGVMFGFLNIAVAAALVWFGREDNVVLDALDERTAESFDFSEAGVTWRHEHLTIEQLDEVRSEFFVGFGSCSFREPMAELGLEAVPRS